MGTRERNSSVELLKVISILLIVLSHAAASAPINTSYGGGNLEVFVSLKILLTNLGQIGNCIFFICSVWFLLESRNQKINKTIKMIMETFLASVFCLSLVLIAGYKVPLKEIVFSFFPLTYGYYWFISCYILVYLIHPYFNIVIERLSQFQHFCIIGVFLILYSFYVLLIGGNFFYYNELIGFISLYFITAYYKKYILSKLNIRTNNLILLPSLIWIIGSILLAILAVNVSIFSNKIMWFNKFINPCFILMGLGLVTLAQKRLFYRPLINYFSSLTLLIFMLHNNKLIRLFVEVDYYNNIFKHHGLEFWIPAVFLYFTMSAILSFFFAFILDKLFCSSFFNRMVEYISFKVQFFFLKTYSYIK